MPNVFGPGVVDRVLRNCVQSLVDAASDRSAVHGMLRQGEGKVHIDGVYCSFIIRFLVCFRLWMPINYLYFFSSFGK